LSICRVRGALSIASVCRGRGRGVSCICRVLGIAGALGISGSGRVWKVSGIGGGWRVSDVRRGLSISSVHRCYLLRRSTRILLLDHGLRGVHLLLRNHAGFHNSGREKVDLVDSTSPHTLVTAGVLNNRHNEYENGIWHKDKPVKPSECFESPKFATVDRVPNGE